jgi:DNA-binding PadR family transcriptional regulator
MVDELILAELEREARHGHALAAALERRGLRVPRSSVHTALRRLERDGLLVGRWQAGRRRRVYRLTSAGGEVLRLRRLEGRRLARR